MPAAIRPFHPDDEDAVVGLWAEAGLLRPWNDPHKDIRRKLWVQPELFLVAVDSGRIVGTAMAGYDGHRGWINYLAVAADRRRAGVGRSLVDAVAAGLRALGCPKINIQIRSDNTSAVEFYEAVGFAADDVVSLGRRLEED